MTDINAVIAKHKGFEFGQPVSGMNRDICYLTFPDGGWSETSCPDYLNDARLYMALFEEMPDECFIQKINNRLYSVGKIEGMGVQTFSRNSSIGTAICLAYKKLHGLE
jgi:hypothetical protein